MQSVKDWEYAKQFHVLAFGRSGVGKTFGAGTFPRPLFMDFDKGIATLRNPAFVSKYGILDVKYEQFTETSIAKGGVVSAHRAFDDAYLFFEKMMKPDMRDTFDTWVIDTATTLSEVALNKALIFMGLSKLSQTHAVAMAQGVVVPKIQDYGAERSLVEQFIAMVKNSGKNTVVLCHEKELYEGDSVVGRVPLLTGKGVEAVCLQFDEVYNIQTKRVGTETKRVIISEAVGRNMGKSRLGIPNDTEWSWPAIEAKLKEISAAQMTAAPASAR